MRRSLSLILSTDTCRRKKDFFRGSKRTNWFESFLTLSQPTIICQNPWHTRQRKNKRFVQRNTCGGTHGGDFAYTKDPKLVFHSHWHLHWHYNTQLWSPCLLHIIFVTFSPVSCGDLWPYFSCSFVLFFCHLFLMGLHRESCLSTLVWRWWVCLFVFCFVLSFFFLQFCKEGNRIKFEAISHMITTGLFRTGTNLCSGFNPVYRRVWGWSYSCGKNRMETWTRKVIIILYMYIFRRKKRTNRKLNFQRRTECRIKMLHRDVVYKSIDQQGSGSEYK